MQYQYFEILLNDLKRGNFTPLLEINQYLMKKFFEYAFDDEGYIREVLNGNTSLFFEWVHPPLRRIQIIACIQALKHNNDEIFKKFYIEYINQKIRGDFSNVSELNEFHTTIFSHFVWNNDIPRFKWTYDLLTLVFFHKIKNPHICRPWIYIRNVRYFDKIMSDVIELCAITKNSEVFKFLFNNQIFKKSSHGKILKKHGCDSVRDNLIEAKYISSPEWKYLNNKEVEIDKIRIHELIKVTKDSGMDKKMIVKFLMNTDKMIFWNFLKNVTKTELSYLTCKNVSILMRKLQLDLHEIPPNFIFDLTKHFFQIHRNTTKEFMRTFKQVVGSGDLTTYEAISIAYHHLDRKLDLTIYSHKYHIENYKLAIQTFLNSSKLIDAVDDKHIDSIHIDNAKNLAIMYEIFPTLQVSIKKTFKYTKSRKSDDTTCSICLDDFDENDKEIQILCGHKLHTFCIDAYIKSQENLDRLKCPVCRTQFHLKSLL